MFEVLVLTLIDCVLDIGMGLGYYVVLLLLLVAYVYMFECYVELIEVVRAVIIGLGIDNVSFWVGDGWEGWFEEVLFDVINVVVVMSGDLL